MPSSLKSHVDLPLIDISQVPSDFDDGILSRLQRHPLFEDIREACKEFGFFCVVNHGIPNTIFQDMESVIQELCDMPIEVKDRYTTSNPWYSYIRTPFSEGFSVSILPESNSVQELCDTIWPQKGNQRFCETIGAYTLYMEELRCKISKIIIASLGLKVETFYHSDFEKCRASLRINRYMSEGKCIEEEILFPHTDLNCFTILYQDDTGGLQIRSKEGKWLNVNPLSNSFVVNVGDSLKAWSNGMYRSAEHRAVCKGWAERYSVPYFVSFSDDKEIRAPSELVSDENPQRYTPFFFEKFAADYLKSIEYKEKRDSAKFLERYAGI